MFALNKDERSVFLLVNIEEVAAEPLENFVHAVALAIFGSWLHLDDVALLQTNEEQSYLFLDLIFQRF